MKLLILLLLLVVPMTINAAEQPVWSFDLQQGRTTSFSYSERNKPLRKSFDETNYQFAVNYEFHRFFSYYGKIIRFKGESKAKESWNRDNRQWETIDKAKFDTSATFGAGGIKIHTPVQKLMSLGFHVGVGFLDNPDDIINSGKFQFNIGAEWVLSYDWRYQIVVSWENISNGRQELGLGGKGSRFYPNKGRNFYNVGIRYRFGRY